MKKTVLFVIALALVISACNSPTGNIVSEPSIYDETASDLSSLQEMIEQPKEQEEGIIDLSAEKEDDFRLNPASLAAKANGVEFSLDKIEHEIKGSDWGKIVHIVSTVHNINASPFKPRIIIRLHDEKDPKEEWYKPKAEFDYGIEELKPKENAAVDVFVNVAFNDINLTKKFEMVLVDGKFDNHRALASIEMDFVPLS
jgi:hypothetical protein